METENTQVKHDNDQAQGDASEVATPEGSTMQIPDKMADKPEDSVEHVESQGEPMDSS